MRLINDFLDDLDTENGYIVHDPPKLSAFQAEMDKFFEKHGIPYLAWMVKAIRDLLRQSAQNFEGDGAEYEDVAFFADLLGVKGDKVEKKRNGQQTVLYALAAMTVIRYDVVNKLQAAFLTDTSMKNFREALENSVSRKYHDFFEVNSTGVLFQTYNAANRYFAKEYEYDKFRYEGGLIADSRDFCVERDGHEFWVYQGEQWNDLDWKGKIDGIDFFVQLGGYNCKHWLEYYKS